MLNGKGSCMSIMKSIGSTLIDKFSLPPSLSEVGFKMCTPAGTDIRPNASTQSTHMPEQFLDAAARFISAKFPTCLASRSPRFDEPNVLSCLKTAFSLDVSCRVFQSESTRGAGVARRQEVD